MQKEITNFTKRFFLFLCFCSLWGVSKAQIQIGAGIDGQFASETVGARLGFSSAGTRVAVGANNYTNTIAAQGRARVFEDVNGVWTQIGSSIEGQAMLEESGTEIALSGDGTTLAVYSPNEGNFFIKIYKDISGVWTQQGTAIYSRASSLVLSEDGSVIGIGNELGGGSCAVYQWNGTAWTQLGTTILGSGYERMGFSADMSADGLTVVLGGTDGKGTVRVYEFVSSAWVQKGTTLVGEANNQRFGVSVSLSSDGTTLAVGANENTGPSGNVSKLGQVKIYKWQNGAWTQLGASIYGELAVDYFGQSVALSADGTVLAASANLGDNPTTGVQNVGYTKRFRWVGNYWMLENTIYGQASGDDTGWRTAISADGNRIAIGAPNNDAVASVSGRVRVFGFCFPPTAYNLTGGGYSCNGTGVVVGLADSDVGVEYQLMRGVPNVSNPVNVGSPVAGTGNAISFGAQTTSGTFIVKANNLTTSCSGFMSGSVAATIENANVMPTISIVSNDIDNTIWATESVTFTATATNGGFFPVYQWKKNGTNVGTGSLTYTDANLANNDIITCELTSSNSCATTPNVTSNSLTMTVNQSLAGAALHFDGSNDYVKLPAGLGAALSSANNTAITLEYWFKGSSVQSAIRLQEVNNPGNFIVAGWGGKHIISTDGGINGIDVGSNVTDGNWHHVAMTWQRNTINGFRSYLDGVLVEERNAADVNLPLVENGLAIGARYDFWYTEEHTNGTIDEVRMWNRALTQCEVQNNMSCELASGQTGLVAYYKFNQGLVFLNNSSVTSLTDASGNGFHATLTNFALTGTTSNWTDQSNITSGVACAPFVAPSISIELTNRTQTMTPTPTINATFTATAISFGTVTYQWKKNNINVGTNSLTYTDNTLVNGDLISCTMLLGCNSLVSNSIKIYTIRYVKPTASGTGDGSSWANASASPQLMINAATAGDEIWVAAGTYLPTHDPFGSTSPTDPRDKTFYLKNEVKLYGGFAGTETALSQRTWQTNATILSGDFNGNDVVTTTAISSNTENAYHVILSVSANSATVLDGFTVRGGLGNVGTSITVATKIIPRGGGAGMYNHTSNVSIQNCIFYGNVISNTNGSGGGGIYNSGSAPNISNCIFTNNLLVPPASGIPPIGGAIFNSTSPATITNCIFTLNNRTAIRNSSSNPSITNCTFSANNARPVISNTSTNTTLTIKNCIIWSHTTGGTQNVDIFNVSGSDATVTNCITNIAYTGTGSNNSISDPKFVNLSDPNGADNIWFTADDGLQLACGTTAFNTATSIGAPTLDIMGNSIFGGLKDIGAYESQIDLSTATLYTIATTGDNCEGGAGLSINLPNSETYVTYQLKNGTNNVGNALVGTGAAMNFGTYNTIGTYTIAATHNISTCTINMTGNAIINPNVTPMLSITITAGSQTMVAGNSITFTATPTNGGATPIYQWKKNGADVGTNTATYTDLTLANNDIISCVMTSNYACLLTNTATSNSISMTVTAPLPGAALRFDGTNDYVALPSSLVTATTDANNTALTIEYWFKGSSLQSAVRLQDVGGYIVAGWNGTHIISSDGGVGAGVSIGATATDGNWHHIAMTWQRNTTNGFKSYVDGVVVAQRTSADVSLPAISSGAIGVHMLGLSEFSNGTIDEVRIWKRALAQCEIQNNMSCELGSGQTDLLAYYQFNQGLGATLNPTVTTLTDASGNGNNGTLTNFALSGLTSNWVSGGAVTTGVSCIAANTIAVAASSNATTTCTDGSLTFSATPTNSGTSPAYQWKKNGNDVGTNAATFTDNSWTNNDAISCVMSVNDACGTTFTANSNSLIINAIDCNTIYTGTAACETYTYTNVSGNAWFDLVTANGIIGRINPQGQNLGTLTLNVGDPNTIPTVGTAKFLSRTINLNSSNAPTGNYLLRLYYYDSELSDLNNVINPTNPLTPTDMNIVWTSGGSGCNFASYNGTTNGTIAAATVAENEYGAANNGFYLEFALDHFTLFGATNSSNGAFPIELLSFSAENKGYQNELFWATETEINNDHFEIERSKDTHAFEKIGDIKGAGNSTTTQYYQFTDATPFNGKNYYRLKQIDVNGSYSYSHVVEVELDIANGVAIFPNPVLEEFHIMVEKPNQSIIITDEIGKILFQANKVPERIDFSTMSKGVHFVIIGNKTFKVVKM